MKTSPVGRALIERYEGLITKAYDDYNDHVVQPGEPVRGTLTIGYGHTSSAGGQKVYVGQVITKDQADELLSKDLASVEADVTRLVKVSLNQNQFDALVSFQFNTGALGKSSALKSLNAGDYAGAADKLTLYSRGNGQVLQGLVNRRAAEKALFNKPYSNAAAHTGAATAVAVGGAAAVAAEHPSNTVKIIAITVIAAIGLWFLIREIKHYTAAEEIKAAPQGVIPNVG